MVAGNNTFDLPCDTALPSTIQSQILDITWKLATVNGGAFFTVGESKNHLFVTGGSANGAFETVLWVGCEAAKGSAPSDLPQSAFDDPNSQSSGAAGEINAGVTQNQGVIDKIWGKFAGLTIDRVDYTRLKFWTVNQKNANAANSCAQLMASLNSDGKPVTPGGFGTCGAWCAFMIQTLLAEGISGATHYILHSIPNQQTNPAKVKPPNNTVELFLEGECNPHQAQGPENNGKLVFTDTILDRKGQRNPGLHEVVAIQGAAYALSSKSIFDPSFGVKTTGAASIQQAEQAWEDQMLMGLFWQAELQNNGSVNFPLIPHVLGQRQTIFI